MIILILLKVWRATLLLYPLSSLLCNMRKGRSSIAKKPQSRAASASIAKLLLACAIIPLLVLQRSLWNGIHEEEVQAVVQLEAVQQQQAAVAVEAPKQTNKNIRSPLIPSEVSIPKAMQVSHATSSDRYPDQYTAVRDYLHSKKIPTFHHRVNLLSFGSSYGNETITLATQYFNDATGFDDVTIQGFDIDTETIDKAKEAVSQYKERALPIQFHDGRSTPLNINGNYNAIFANSVLCDATSVPYDVETVMNHFSFEDFEENLMKFDSVLKVGGVLAMINTSYRFEDSELMKSGRYEPIAKCLGNHVPYVDVEKREFIMNDEKVERDCVWKKLRRLK
jgi:hypothetical protein